MRMPTVLLSLVTLFAACGGSKKEPAKPEAKEEAAPATDTKDEAKSEAKGEKEAPAAEDKEKPAPEPKTWKATAALEAFKGTKVKATTVSLTQEEGKDTSVQSDGWFEGLAKGKYRLVVHDGSECGANGKKAGAVWKGSAEADLSMTAGKDKKANIDSNGIKLPLDGDGSVVGKTLALHADAKGKPGKMLACGKIEKTGGE
jgi:hypothetical protein